MTNANDDEKELVASIQAGGARRDDALKRLYLQAGTRASVFRQVLQNGGTASDAQDVFQDALVLLDRNVREGRFEGKSTLSTYFVAIAKWHWLSRRRANGRYTDFKQEFADAEVESVESGLLQEEHRSLLDSALGQIGERCRALLRLYQLDYSMEEIAQQLSYNSADVAKKEAYRCRMKFRDLLEQNPAWAELLHL